MKKDLSSQLKQIVDYEYQAKIINQQIRWACEDSCVMRLQCKQVNEPICWTEIKETPFTIRSHRNMSKGLMAEYHYYIADAKLKWVCENCCSVNLQCKKEQQPICLTDMGIMQIEFEIPVPISLETVELKSEADEDE